MVGTRVESLITDIEKLAASITDKTFAVRDIDATPSKSLLVGAHWEVLDFVSDKTGQRFAIFLRLISCLTGRFLGNAALADTVATCRAVA